MGYGLTSRSKCRVVEQRQLSHAPDSSKSDARLPSLPAV
jgi:hypothetical protein